MKRRRKPHWIFVLFGVLFSVYAGYLAGGAWESGSNAFVFVSDFARVLKKPFGNYFSEYTLSAILFTLFLYALVMLMYYTSIRNYMPGQEYGTAKYANVKEVNQALKDKDKDYNRIFSQNVRMSMNTRYTKLNNNVLIIGGSGAGKTFYEVKPNLMQMPKNCSFIVTDPKGEILRSCGQMLKDNGYNIKVINLVEMEKSDCYNPFAYIRSETDIIRLITNLMANTTPKGSNPTDPFWDKAESLFLQALFYYVWMAEQPANRNMKTVLKLLAEAEVQEKGQPSNLDLRMRFLQEGHPLGENHPAVKQYNKCMRGAGDTIRSIIIAANARLAYLENEQVLRMLSRDDLNLAELGIGINGDGHSRTALFCVIPDNDKSYNFIVGMLYTQIFQELYYQADFNYGGRLPVHVTFMLDEFCNVALPDDYCSLLSTMRSREISSVIIIQNLAQIKALFKDTWETIPGNCDTHIYLGGNEQSSHKYVSESMGKGTIDKRTTGETRGRQGSASRNYDVLGRELMTPDEIRKLDNKKCVVFIRGFDPIMDDKFDPFGHPRFHLTADGDGESYVHRPSKVRKKRKAYELLNENSVAYFERCKKKDETIYMDTFTFAEFKALSEVDFKKRIREQEEKEKKAKLNEERARELEYSESDVSEVAIGDDNKQEEGNDNSDTEGKKSSIGSRKPKLKGEDSVANRMVTWAYSKEQKDVLRKALKDKMPNEHILSFFYPDIPVEQMLRAYEDFMAQEKRQKGGTKK